MSHSINHTRAQSPARIYETNYHLLGRLLPDLSSDSLLLCTDDGTEQLSIDVTQRCRYTTMLELHKPFRRQGKWLPDMRIAIRIYHDARVVEATSYQGCNKIPAPYEPRDGARFVRDERRQLNRLLYDLLCYLLQQGYRQVAQEVE